MVQRSERIPMNFGEYPTEIFDDLQNMQIMNGTICYGMAKWFYSNTKPLQITPAVNCCLSVKSLV